MDSAVSGEEGPAGARAAAESFVHAVVWGEHTVLWDLLSDQGRATALAVARRNGLDRVVASRIQDDLADPSELDDFLGQLLEGVRRDLRSVDTNEIRVAEVSMTGTGMGTANAVATLVVPSLLPGPDWAAGHLDLRCDAGGRWRVDRLEPRLAGP